MSFNSIFLGHISISQPRKSTKTCGIFLQVCKLNTNNDIKATFTWDWIYSDLFGTTLFTRDRMETGMIRFYIGYLRKWTHLVRPYSRSDLSWIHHAGPV